MFAKGEIWSLNQFLAHPACPPPPKKKPHKKQKPTKASWTCLEKGTVLSLPPHDKVYMHNMHGL